MNKLINETRVILIGGSSHAGKSTLGGALGAAPSGRGGCQSTVPGLSECVIQVLSQ